MFNKGRRRRLPRENWAEVPIIAEAVRIVDICSPVHNALAPANAADLGLSFTPVSTHPDGGGEDVDYVRSRIFLSEMFDRLEFLRGAPSFDPIEEEGEEVCWSREECWCGLSRQTAVRLLAVLAKRLRHVTLVRQWGMHVCPQPIVAERTLSFNLPPPDAAWGRERYPPPTSFGAITSPIHDSYGGDQAGPQTQPNTGIKLWQSPGRRVTEVVIRLFDRVTSGYITGDCSCRAAERVVPDPHSECRFGCRIRLADTTAIRSVMLSLVSPLIRGGITCTLVGFDSWPNMATACETWMDDALSGDPSSRECFLWALANWNRFDLGVAEKHVKFMSVDEYAASVGDRRFALEKYCWLLRDYGPL